MVNENKSLMAGRRSGGFSMHAFFEDNTWGTDVCQFIGVVKFCDLRIPVYEISTRGHGAIILHFKAKDARVRYLGRNFGFH